MTSHQHDSKKIAKMKADVPYAIRGDAVRDLIKAKESAYAGFKARIKKQKTHKSRWKKRKKVDKLKGRRRFKKRKAFHLKFKSKRLTRDSFNIQKNNIYIEGENLYLYAKTDKFGSQEPIKLTEELQCRLECDCRISYCFGRWYLLVPYDVEKMDVDTGDKIIALDPGVRTFATYFTSESEQGDIGSDTEKMADKMNKKIEGIRKAILKAKKDGDRKKVKHLNQSWYRNNARASNLVDDFHWKTIRFLVDNFDVIIAPKLSSSEMLKRESLLPVITRKRMAFQRHGEFWKRLEYKVSVTPGTILHDLEEHGTSATCSSCGWRNPDLGSSKVYKCKSCGMVAGRDSNAAKNHLLKPAFGNSSY